MIINRKIRVLIVDDSLFVRETLRKGLSKDSSIEVVATAANPYEARDKIIDLEPDVMTLDVEMPRMNGIEFLRRLMPQYPMPVIVVSAVDKNVFDALNAGAVDFVTKPSAENPNGVESLINELIVKIKIASTAKLGNWKMGSHDNDVIKGINGDLSSTLIAIGASTGGTEAIAQILKAFPKEMPGIVIVQHMPPVFTRMYAERLNNSCLLEVKEAENGDKILPGRVLIAPGNFQMRVRKNGSIRYVEIFNGEKVSGHCPSVDVLFESVASQIGHEAIGVILTGMGHDGANGLLKMRQKGSRTLGQNQESCIVYGMPKVAFDIGAVERQAPLEKMANAIYSMINGGEN